MRKQDQTVNHGTDGNTSNRSQMIRDEDVECCSAVKKLFKKNGEPHETVILEQTIIKIGALLALGFGEAGVKIIADNMANTGDVDPMIPGNKVVAIFGFCDIRQFTDTTEIL